KLVLQVFREPVDDLRTPAFRFLPIENHPPNVPIQREQLPIGGQPGAHLRSLHPRLDRREQPAVITGQGCSGKATGHGQRSNPGSSWSAGLGALAAAVSMPVQLVMSSL